MKHFHCLAPALLGAILVAAPAWAQDTSLGGSLGVGFPLALEDGGLELSFTPGVVGTLDISTPLLFTASWAGAFMGRMEFGFLAANLDEAAASNAFLEAAFESAGLSSADIALLEATGVSGPDGLTLDAKGDYYTLALTGNFLYESPLPGYKEIIVYGGVGIGYTYTSIGLDQLMFQEGLLRGLAFNDNVSSSEFDFHWQLIVGADYALNDQIRIGFDVRYVSGKVDDQAARNIRLSTTFRRSF